MTTTTIELPKITNTMPLFDVDAHWAEPPDLWTSRAPAKYKDKVMHVRTLADGSQAWFVGDSNVFPCTLNVIRPDLSKQLATFTLTNYAEMTPSMTNSADRVKVLDKLGIGSQILYSNAIGFGAATLLKVGADADLRLFHIQAYNDALAEEQKKSNGRVLGQAILPLWDIDLAIKEMTRAKEELGLVGISMSDQPQEWGQPSLCDPKWDNFWAACQDLNVPVNFHIGSGEFEGATNEGLRKYWGEREFFRREGGMNGDLAMYQSVSMFMGNVNDVLNLLTNDILERFPRLKWVSVESGLSWIPFVVQSLEVNWNELMTAQQRSRYKRTPRERFMEQIYVSYWFENGNAIDFYAKEFGVDNVMFQTDLPHPNCLYPGVQAKVDESLKNFSQEDRAKVMYRNAEKLYGVKVGQIGA